MAHAPETSPIPRPAFQTGAIRPFRPSDTDAATQILAQSPDAASWSSEGQERLLSQSGVVALVSQVGSTILGFIVARQVAGEGEILNIAVAPQARRTGHGSALLRAVLQVFQHQHVGRAFLEVRESNTTAIAFYRKHGFVPIGRRKAYYRDPKEDALVMERNLTAQ